MDTPLTVSPKPDPVFRVRALLGHEHDVGLVDVDVVEVDIERRIVNPAERAGFEELEQAVAVAYWPVALPLISPNAPSAARICRSVAVADAFIASRIFGVRPEPSDFWSPRPFATTKSG